METAKAIFAFLFIVFGWLLIPGIFVELAYNGTAYSGLVLLAMLVIVEVDSCKSRKKLDEEYNRRFGKEDSTKRNKLIEEYVRALDSGDQGVIDGALAALEEHVNRAI